MFLEEDSTEVDTFIQIRRSCKLSKVICLLSDYNDELRTEFLFTKGVFVFLVLSVVKRFLIPCQEFILLQKQMRREKSRITSSSSGVSDDRSEMMSVSVTSPLSPVSSSVSSTPAGHSGDSNNYINNNYTRHATTSGSECLLHLLLTFLFLMCCF